MLKGIGRGLALFMMATILAGASSEWPKLPKNDGFIRGRPAQLNDMKAGNAAFVAKEKGKLVGKPIRIKIPQYGYVRSIKQYVIVIQAENALGIPMLGVRDFEGNRFVALQSDVDLLGTRPRK